jgi:hypothetical protein
LADSVTSLKQRYHNTFEKTEDGRVVLKDLMKRARFFGPLTVAGDPVATAYNDGQRMAVVHILQMLNVADHDLDRAITSMSSERVIGHDKPGNSRIL